MIGIADKGDTMVWRPGAFDTNDTCIMASCNSCRGVFVQTAKQFTLLCHCQGGKVLELAAGFSKRIIADWKLGEVDKQNPDFKNTYFTLPVSYRVCNRFISHEVKELVAEEVIRNKERKTKQDPTWIARNWETLHSFVHNNYDLNC